MNSGAAMGRHSFFGALALAALFSACSLVTDFDQDDKPCDGYQRCEDGYYCQVKDVESGAGVCVKGSTQGGAALKATGAAREGGLVSAEESPCAEGVCRGGLVCDRERQVCVPQT